MITVEEPLEKVLSRIRPLGSENVSILDAPGRVMAEDISAYRDIPALDNSAMDGYPVRSEDIRNAEQNHPVRLDVIEDLPAGFLSVKTLGKGEAIRRSFGLLSLYRFYSEIYIPQSAFGGQR